MDGMIEHKLSQDVLEQQGQEDFSTPPASVSTEMTVSLDTLQPDLTEQQSSQQSATETESLRQELLEQQAWHEHVHEPLPLCQDVSESKLLQQELLVQLPWHQYAQER